MSQTDVRINLMDQPAPHTPPGNPSVHPVSQEGLRYSPGAESHFAAGILMAHQGQPEAAVRHFQQALAFITCRLGITRWFAGYLEDHAEPRTHSHRLLTCIYENLSRCWLHLGHFTNADIAVEAAMQFSPGQTTLCRLKEEIVIKGQLNSAPGAMGEEKPVVPGHRTPWTEQVTLLMATHFTEKLDRNRHLAPPGIGLVQSTYSSMLEVLGHEIRQCPKILIYDRNAPCDPREELYRENLTRFTRENGFELVESNCGGLQRNFTAAIENIGTPYILWVEHDWQFLPPGVDLAGVVRAFERYPEINMVRFNKRRNTIAGFDFLMEKETNAEGIDLIRTPAYSNNPQVVRTEKLRTDWLPLCQSDATARQYDLSRTAFGIEEPLFKGILHAVRQLGFGEAHAHWGTYVYGQVNDPPKIRHLGC